ncbi:MAG: dihydroxy-acid dehydratase [Gemmatimonadetes bacterium]|nr:dihydroxy-acid dehydratase [Gemmatimonadota bacterium]
MPSPTGIDRNLTHYADPGFSRYIRRAFLASAGYDEADLERPVIGIADTSSDYTTCHRAMPQLVEAVKRGVLEAGGLPLVFPTLSLGEILLSPTAMLYRNLMAMATEEMIAAQPMDAVVLLGGCDKTLPAQLMASASASVPAIHLVAGPMLAGDWRGERLGACTDCRRYWAQHRAGALDAEEIAAVEQSLCPTAGTCMVMGTASTMACVTEALGLMLPGAATPPAVSGQRLRLGVATGRRAVALATEGRPARDILTPAAFANALKVLAALSGSTNAVVHLLAIARRAGVDLSLDDFHTAAQQVPLLVDCKPAGTGYMEDFDKAGGVPVLLKALEPMLDLDAVGVSGQTLGALLQNVAAPGAWQTAIRTLDAPLGPASSLVVLKGSLAPDGAVLKKATSSPHLHKHRGPAIVFEGPDDAERVDDPALGITPEHVLVLRGAGPVALGMPEAGSMPLPKHLAAQGVEDMVRVSDGRMSGTAYGTVALHVAPEAAVGGPLALVRDGDLIELDVEAGRLDLLVPEETLARRRAEWSAPDAPTRGWRHLYAERVLQANLGADLDFC